MLAVKMIAQTYFLPMVRIHENNWKPELFIFWFPLVCRLFSLFFIHLPWLYHRRWLFSGCFQACRIRLTTYNVLMEIDKINPAAKCAALQRGLSLREIRCREGCSLTIESTDKFSPLSSRIRANPATSSYPCFLWKTAYQPLEQRQPPKFLLLASRQCRGRAFGVIVNILLPI